MKHCPNCGWREPRPPRPLPRRLRLEETMYLFGNEDAEDVKRAYAKAEEDFNTIVLVDIFSRSGRQRSFYDAVADNLLARKLRLKHDIDMVREAWAEGECNE